jgi:uncharacterized protein (DUF427 family)
LYAIRIMALRTIAPMRGLTLASGCASPYFKNITIADGGRVMKASVDGRVVAQSEDIVVREGYQYFPSAAVRMDWLEKTERTKSDLACPHGVQFYDVVVDGKRHARAAWSYEAPQPKMAQVKGRFGFWKDVEVR